MSGIFPGNPLYPPYSGLISWMRKSYVGGGAGIKHSSEKYSPHFLEVVSSPRHQSFANFSPSLGVFMSKHDPEAALCWKMIPSRPSAPLPGKTGCLQRREILRHSPTGRIRVLRPPVTKVSTPPALHRTSPIRFRIFSGSWDFPPIASWS